MMLVVTFIKLPEAVKLTAVAVPLKAGFKKGAFNNKSEVVASPFDSVNTLVVQLLNYLRRLN